jgi:hypothetical protein
MCACRYTLLTTSRLLFIYLFGNLECCFWSSLRQRSPENCPTFGVSDVCPFMALVLKKSREGLQRPYSVFQVKNSLWSLMAYANVARKIYNKLTALIWYDIHLLYVKKVNTCTELETLITDRREYAELLTEKQSHRGEERKPMQSLPEPASPTILTRFPETTKKASTHELAPTGPIAVALSHTGICPLRSRSICLRYSCPSTPGQPDGAACPWLSKYQCVATFRMLNFFNT